jgi:BirA family biotin operon repressor/biotin-[acetyl-CoA-carboxylase] ligase
MRIIKLNAIDSTNSFLRELSLTEPIEDYTVVVADYQKNGRGQMGTQWSSQQSKNLMVSVFKDVSFLQVDRNFYISVVISLSILKALETLHINKLSIKWPNDILSDNKKLAGILIENVIKYNKLQASVIGFGLNVNQTKFIDLPKASSLRLITGKVFDLDEVLQEILNQMKIYFEYLKAGQRKLLKTEYEKHLFRKGKPSTFKNSKGNLFGGIILGISESGSLRIQIEDTIVKEFDLKEVTLLY